MPKFIPVREAKAKLSEVLNRARYRREHFLVTRKDVPWAVIMGVEEYEDLIDRLDTMVEQLDPGFQKSLEKSMEEYRAGEFGTIDDIRKLLKVKSKHK